MTAHPPTVAPRILLHGSAREEQEGMETMANYKKGPWDQVDQEAGETEAAHIGIDQRLTEYPEGDRQMDRYQDLGYIFVKEIVKHSVDPWARKSARQALAAFRRAETLETINEEHVAHASEELLKARGHNHNVIGIAEENRWPTGGQRLTPANVSATPRIGSR